MKKSLFIISILINVLFISGTAFFYFKANSLANDHPFKLFSQRRTSFFSSFAVTPESVVFLGDSITDEGRWSEIYPGLNVHNRGVMADRTEHVLARIHQITKGQPEMIFLMIGTNDLRMGIPQETILSNYRSILKSINEQSPDSRVFVQSILPRKTAYQQQIENLNQKILSLSKEFDYAFIDLYSAFLDKDGSIQNEYSNDELHLKGAGYQRWKSLIRPYLGFPKNTNDK
ncbi:MAG: sialate O-acetylesterase [Desulfobacteraceae bacterium]|nr:sialate O-acetylesterase [Desulfobacteraceae bacterium]